jgi:hypothetical protein
LEALIINPQSTELAAKTTQLPTKQTEPPENNRKRPVKIRPSETAE